MCTPAEKAFDKGAHLSMKDVQVDILANPQTMQVKIKASETDPFRQGVLVYVGKTNKPLCPVSALLAYMVMRGKGPGPLFIFQDGKPLLHKDPKRTTGQHLKEAGGLVMTGSHIKVYDFNHCISCCYYFLLNVTTYTLDGVRDIVKG